MFIALVIGTVLGGCLQESGPVGSPGGVSACLCTIFHWPSSRR